MTSARRILAVIAILAGLAGENVPAQGRRFRTGPLEETDDMFQTRTLPKDDQEKKILEVLDEMYKTQRRGNMNVPTEDGRVLRLLTESINAMTVVEIGTSNGYSALWMCMALQKTGGKLITMDIDAKRLALAKENFKKAGVLELVTIIEGDAHKKVKDIKDPIDLIFLDADKEGYVDYLEKLLPQVKPGGLIVAHNMTPRMADPKYVKAITGNPKLETLFIHMDRAGLGIAMKKR